MTAREPEPTVFVVDDDEAVRASLRLLLKSLGIPAITHGSAAEFLAEVRTRASRLHHPGCAHAGHERT